VTDGHEEWLRQIEAEVAGTLPLAQRAALARHVATCPRCASARVSRLELEASFARAHGTPHALVVRRSVLRGHTVVLWATLALGLGLLAGWLAHARWGGPGRGTLESSRATILVR
jgi:hypothetical protein